jgi:hypothetical protein
LVVLEVPATWANTIRNAFQQKNRPVVDAPVRVTFQYLADGSFVLHNYNREKERVEIQLPHNMEMRDGFSGENLHMDGKLLKLEMAPRSRIWCTTKN